MSLQEILMQRAALHFQNELGPTSGGTPSDLWSNVADSIVKAREKKSEQAALKQRNDEAIAQYSRFSNMNSDAIGALEPELKITKDGVFEFTAKTPSRSSEATRIKTQREIQESEGFRQAVRSGMPSEDIARQYPSMIKEIKELESIGVIGPQIQQTSPQISSIDEYGSVVRPQQTQPVPAQTISQGDSVVTERTPQGRPDKIISRSGKIEEGQISTIGKVQEEQTKAAVKAVENYNRIKNASIGLVAAAKRIVKEQGGLGTAQILKGKAQRFIQKTGLVKDDPLKAQAGMAEYRGQVKEMVLALSPILTNQNRVIQGIIDMLGETLWDPNKPTTGTEFTAQLKQTAKNAFRLSNAIASGMLTADEINTLQTSGDPAKIKERMKDVLDRSSWSKENEEFFEAQWQEIISTPATTPESLFQSGGQSNLKSKYGLR